MNNTILLFYFENVYWSPQPSLPNLIFKQIAKLGVSFYLILTP
jgi:hypothetical protein